MLAEAVIQLPESQRAYSIIFKFLEDHRTSLFTVEILPKNYPLPESQDVLISESTEDGNTVFAIGIPASKLVKAFAVAHSKFFAALPQIHQNVDLRTEIFYSSTICLLLHPENFTVANARKRLLNAELEAGNTERLLAFWKADLSTVANLLSSPLKRHTKSPTLWHHRKWLFTKFLDLVQAKFDSSPHTLAMFGLSTPKQAGRIFSVISQTAERDLVFKAGGWHRHNYYAWEYARCLVSQLGLDADESDWLPATEAWARSHSQDTSGWAFLLWLHKHFQSRDKSIKEDFSLLLDTTVMHALQWSQESESIWTFIRRALAGEIPLSPTCRDNVCGQIAGFLARQMLSLEELDSRGMAAEGLTEAGKTNLISVISQTLAWVALYASDEAVRQKATEMSHSLSNSRFVESVEGEQ
jgi:protein prenyltransferase alpha subunit repeat containing protein 1